MTLTARNKSFFLWALRSRTQKLADLVRHLPEDVRSQLVNLQNQADNLDAEKSRAFAINELRKFARASQQNYLPDVHPDWLLAKLKTESPQVISLILRLLPADRVRPILNGLPASLLSQLPKMNAAYAIPAGLAEFVKRRFESHFQIDRVYDSKHPFTYSDLIHLKPDFLNKMFREIGYREMALGLKLLPAKTQDLVMSQLPAADRLVVEKYMLRDSGHVSEARHKKAQVHLISQEAGIMGQFVQEIGFLVFAKTVLPENMPDVQILAHKIPIAAGQHLMKVAEAHLNQNSPASVLVYREELLLVCQSLGK